LAGFQAVERLHFSIDMLSHKGKIREKGRGTVLLRREPGKNKGHTGTTSIVNGQLIIRPLQVINFYHLMYNLK
ncbi:MAG: hypothetical protein LBC40_05255, partial [Dysgonamonadaceae bacterium]|nr:hypothetical protein [Dysgonamonadaceae bacterium]